VLALRQAAALAESVGDSSLVEQCRVALQGLAAQID
jgi:hypothetical protein